MRCGDDEKYQNNFQVILLNLFTAILSIYTLGPHIHFDLTGRASGVPEFTSVRPLVFASVTLYVDAFLITHLL